jgi:hypothetical protein
MVSDDLVMFLRARLAEDEAEARETSDADAEFWSDVKGDGAYFDRFAPARVLREVEAKRAILDDCERDLADDACDESARWRVRVLAAVYRDHPGYDPAWAVRM